MRPSCRGQQLGVLRLTMIGCCILTTGSNGSIIDEANVRMILELVYTSSTDISIGRHISCLVYKGTDKRG